LIVLAAAMPVAQLLRWLFRWVDVVAGRTRPRWTHWNEEGGL